MNFECWSDNAWAAASWVEGSWCPGTPPVPPTPEPVRVEARRNPGPSIMIYQEPLPKINRRKKKENDEIIIL